jgi:hypothetical protein
VAVEVAMVLGVLVAVGVVGVRVRCVPVGVGVHDNPEHPCSALFTAWTSNAMSTSAPFGVPCGHADGWAVPRAMSTRMIISFTVT